MSEANAIVRIRAITDPDEIDRHWMGFAVAEGAYSAECGERPFGCLIVRNGIVIAKGWGSESPTDPIRHSEIGAIQEACERVGGLLQGCTLYSTHEPCTLCCGAIAHSKLSRVVYGSARADLPLLFRQRWISAEDLLADTSNPPQVVSGILRDECIALFDEEVSKLRANQECQRFLEAETE